MADKSISAQPIRPPAPRIRRDFSRIPEASEIPNLLEIQQWSDELILQLDMLPDEREPIGMQAVFDGVFPITNFNKTASLEFVSYELGTWECHCGTLRGMEQRYSWRCSCGSLQGVKSLEGERPVCSDCGKAVEYIICPHCEKRVSLKMKYSVKECRERGLSLSAPLKVRVRLVVWDKEADSEEREIRDIKEEEVYLGELPIMTDVVEHPDGRISVGSKGIFIINGTERVIVSQMHRSPGVFFKHDSGKQQASGKLIFSARLIPYRGSWIEFEFDSNDILHVKIDRKRKLLASVLLRALGYTENQEILRLFYSTEHLKRTPEGWLRTLDSWIVGDRAFYDFTHPKTGDVIVAEDEKISKRIFRDLKAAGIEEVLYGVDRLVGRVVVDDVVDEDGVVILECNSEITHETALRVHEVTEESLELIFLDGELGGALHETLLKDKLHQSPDPQREAQVEIYKRLRPGDPLTPEAAQRLFERYFFDPKNYDLSKVGRLKVNKKLGLDVALDHTTLQPHDVYSVMRYLINLRYGRGSVDDIDHLGNRRVRCVGELLQNHLRIGLVRMERAVRERMSIQDMATSVPHELINAKPVTAALNEFFGSSQLSQFMDQNNPLAELTHKRRLSALGPGGLSRERAGFEVRDVHTTHYGRICPIETPEGPNVGLIVSLSSYARVTNYGFIETPYRKVTDSRVTDEIEYLTALDEDAEVGPEGRKYVIAQANTVFDPETGALAEERAAVRSGSDIIMAPRDQINYMDVSPRQLVSVSTALVPFLENDDANRALMGSNMQRQAVPLLRTEAPLVGTGVEYVAAYDSGAVLTARRSGIVETVAADRIIIRADVESAREGSFFAESNIDIYKLTKFQRSNQATCINQKPLVLRGQRVSAGEVIADGPATDHGDLALGRNILAAFMPWGGYNFEDAILVSERVVKEDLFTSIHIEVFETEARDTKLGKEEITRDIPNVSEENLRNLDASGIIRIGAEVRTGDVLVGKITPKGETQLTPEEKLLRAIFGEKAGDVRDASLTVPPGVEGTVIDVKVFSRRGAPKDSRSEEILQDQLVMIAKDFSDERTLIQEEAGRKARSLLLGQTTAMKLEHPVSGEVLIKAKQRLTENRLEAVPDEYLDRLEVKDKAVMERMSELHRRTNEQIEIIRKLHQEREERLQKGDELSPGVIKMVKVFLAVKRKLQVGDKMAGRHGNKGVISKIVPEADMPFLPDGMPVDIVLNPLGVPSRMNVGQILETKLGWASFGLGQKAAGLATRPDDQVDMAELRQLLDQIYPKADVRERLAELSDEGLIRFARNLKTGVHVATPVFDGATEDEIKGMLELGELPTTGKTTLFDGRTGNRFDQDVTVGMMYMLKLHHLVDEKIHARSIGPYSLVTQQPLGGRAQFGGQRFGEMEVWALEAYGAAHTLQELLTVKSDDVLGRTRVYQAIVKGETMQEPGIPESFNVLVKELQSLALDVELIDSAKTTRRAGDRLMAL